MRGSLLGHLSLMHGWLPATMQLLAALVLVAGLGWRTRRWRLLWLPVSAAFGTVLAAAAYWYVGSTGMAGDPAPVWLWVWIALTGLAAAAAVAGWRSSRWWRRTLAVLAVPLTVSGAATTLNSWIGYVPTVGAAWTELTSGPLPDQADRATISAMQRSGTVPPKGTVVAVNIDSGASHFRHREELVYLPPGWYASSPPPPLPAVMMIGGEFNTPTDWLRAGDAIATLDAFAAAHAGQAPVVVFVDSGGSFNTDTECVNGPRGNAADHLTKEVVPFLIHTFAVSAAPANWGVVGFSAGGTCAVDLTVTHPELFHTFVDIAGDLGPTSGTITQTIDRLFGGSRTAWEAFDPTTVITRHGHYQGISGVFALTGTPVDGHGQVTPVHNGEYDAATQLCGLGRVHGIECNITAVAGKHDWPCAGHAFAATLPWLAAKIGTPGIPSMPIPQARTATPTATVHPR